MPEALLSNPLRKLIVSRHGNERWEGIDALLAPFRSYVRGGCYRLLKERQLIAREPRIRTVLKKVTGRPVEQLQWRTCLAGVEDIRVRRLFWEDVEEYLEAGLDSHFRVGINCRERWSAVQYTLEPLGETFRQTFGDNFFHLGAPTLTLWLAVQYSLGDLILFEVVRELLFCQHKAFDLERALKGLHSLHWLLMCCIPIGEVTDKPGTWEMLCA